MTPYNRRVVGVSLAVILLLALAASVGFAQTPTGNIRGEVADPSGMAVPKAPVKITEVATNRTIDVTTGDAGEFVVTLLLPGVYNVRVEVAGFKTVVQQVTVRAGGTAEVRFKLEVGAISTVVEVSAQMGAQVDTVGSKLDDVVTGRQIEQMPMNARNFLSLAALTPGVLIRDGGNIDPTKSVAYLTVGVIGRSGTGTRVQVDGIDVTDETVGTTMANISSDAVSEFQLTRSSLDLSTSLTSSGAVNIITRTGANDIHGSAFYFYRNQDMGARLNFEPTSLPFHRHQVGYRAGGPFIKNKLFWFSNWERTYQAEQGIYPSGANFPNIPFGSSNNCLQGCAAGIPTNLRYITQRLDWNITKNLRFFYRFGYDDNLVAGGTIPVSPFANKDWTIIHAAGLDATTGRLTHSFRFGYVNFNNKIVSTSFSGFDFLKTPQGTPYFLSVENFQLGPNGLAPQETYQDNFQSKYDGSLVWGAHTIRYGLEVNRIILGGYANFAGPLSITGDFTSTTQQDVITRGANPQDPLQYPLVTFSTGPNNGFFTAQPCHGFAHGCHKNTRIAWYVGDTWRARKNLHINFGTRWEYDTGYFNNEGVSRPSFLDFYGKGISTTATFPKNRFGPQFGFAWDPWSNGKTSIRGGAYLAYEMNIYNNLIFDEFTMLPPGIGPDVYSEGFISKPDGTPISPAVAGLSVSSLPPACQAAIPTSSGPNQGVWTCLTQGTTTTPAPTIGSVLNIIGAVDKAMKDSYATFQFNPASGTPLLEIAQSDVFGFVIGGTTFKIPYSIQMNLGFQRELWKNNVISVDYIFNHGVGMPFLGVDLECRRCASTLNVAAARAQRDAVLAGQTVDQWIAAHPTGTLSSFGLASDGVYTGLTPSPSAPTGFLQTTGLLRLRTMQGGGFSKYRGLHVQFRGEVKNKAKVVKAFTYTVSYAWGIAEATNASNRSEFLNTASNKFQPNSAAYFGPTGLDRKHALTIGGLLDVPGGFRISQFWTFRTAPPLNLFIPAIGLTGQNALFSTDVNGDGSSGTSPLADVLPGSRLGALGRDINSWAKLNQVIMAYNASTAGQITPAGRALVTAGLFTENQLKSLKAVSPIIATIPGTNPWPFENFFNLDVGISRPVHINQIREGFVVEPWFQVFNVFNNTALNTYGGGLDGRFGSLNFDYLSPANQSSGVCGGNCVANLAASRGRNNTTRLLQVGVRVTF